MVFKFLKFRYFLLVLLLVSAVIAYAKINSANEAFSQAKDFPEGALLYAQFQDLPALYKIWDESELKQKYLESVNFREFENEHLAMKLVSRLSEFEEASNFPLDISAVLSSSETKAAIAVYDIGRLEFVFVAPLSEDKILASQFFLNKSTFEENTLEDKTIVYGKNVASDRGRQPQKLLFAFVKGRFVLATDEVKFFKTLAIINGKSKENNLFDAPEFRNLSKKTEPHQATIWVDQRKLNDDWYFKNYWAFKNLENLKKIRAGIFDFEMQENKLIERRKFLLNGKANEKTKISANEINDLQNFIPKDVPHFSFQAIDKSSDFAAKEIRKTLLDGFSAFERKSEKAKSSGHFYSEIYYRHSSNFESEINEIDEDFEINEGSLRDENALIIEINSLINAANPQTSANLISPHSLPMPLFFENRRGFVLTLQNPQNLNREKLENALSLLALNQLTVSRNKTDLSWKTIEENSKSRRELELPFLGWKMVYSIQNNTVIFANNVDFLKQMLENNPAEMSEANGKFDEFTTLRFNLHDQVFDSVISKIREEEAKNSENESVDFFTDNVGSLFGVLSNINRVEIRKGSTENYMTVELEFFLN